MEKITYKTNIRNEEDLRRVAPLLNSAVGSENWEFNSHTQERKLVVNSQGAGTEVRVSRAFQQAGFNAMNLDDYYAIF